MDWTSGVRVRTFPYGWVLCLGLARLRCSEAQSRPLDPGSVPPGLQAFLGRDDCGSAEWVPRFHQGLADVVGRAQMQDFAGALSAVAGLTAAITSSHAVSLECATVVGAGLYIAGQSADNLGLHSLAARLRQMSSIFTAYDYQMKGEEFIDQSPWPIRWMDAMDEILRSMAHLKQLEVSAEQWRGLTMSAALNQRLPTVQRTRSSGLSVAIVSVCDYDAGQTPLARLSQINKEEYARKHGYDVTIYDKAPTFHDGLSALMTDPPSHRPAAWSKVDAILTALASARHDWVMWMDCDSFFMDVEVSLDKIIGMVMAESKCRDSDAGLDDLRDLRSLVEKWHAGPEEALQGHSLQAWFDDLFDDHWAKLGYSCGEHDLPANAPINKTLGWDHWLYKEKRPHLIASEDGLMLNTGIVLIRSSSWSWQFFQKVRAMTFGHSSMTQHPWWEQTAMVYLLQLPFTLVWASRQTAQYGLADITPATSQGGAYAPACFMMSQKQINAYPPLVAAALKTHVAYEVGDFIVSFSGCKVYSSQETCNYLFLSHFVQVHGTDVMETDPALRFWL